MAALDILKNLRNAIVGCAVLLLCLCATHAHADDVNFKTLLMPGKLTAAHAKLESDCANCHVSFAKEAQGKLCVHCHEQIAADLAGKRGFHGKLDAQNVLNCKQCHTDHKGRNADILNLNRQKFDHAATNFKLEGKHAGVACARCHEPDKKFRAASSACFSCHRSDDRHRGGLGQQCANCHNANGWKPATFDHNTTRFVLKGGHLQASCSACHVDEHYKNTPQACIECHAKDDTHHGDNGRQCQRCHNETTWKKSTFDHARDTHFVLRGAHAKTNCSSCHRGGNFETKLQTECVACHRNDNTHKGRFGERCESCHNETTWKQQKFDHGTTQFALRGKHADVACNSCHRTDPTEKSANEKLTTTCIGCHRADDAHKGQLGEQCENCHNETGWKNKVNFDHARTVFPLVGAHATTRCDSCHASSAFKGTPTACVACHKKDDKHRGALGANCNSCHNSTSWKTTQFDHGKQTQFALDGAHAQLQCVDCHREPADKVKLARDCHSCHAADDEHGGRFGRACERCHDTQNFKNVNFKNMNFN